MVICTPYKDIIPAADIIESVALELGVEWLTEDKYGRLIFANRNLLVERAGDDDILFWDADVSATAANVRAIRSTGYDIIGGACQYEKYPNKTVAGKIAKNINDCAIPWTETGLNPVIWVGAGFLFVKKDVFKKMQKPYFRHEFIGETQTGEDVGFCINAARSGFNIYLYSECKVIHPYKKENVACS